VHNHYCTIYQLSLSHTGIWLKLLVFPLQSTATCMIYCKTIITTWQNVDNRTLKTLYGRHHFTKNNTQYRTIYQWDYLNREFVNKRLVFPLQFTATCDTLYAVCCNVCLYYRTNDSMCNTFIREVKRACPTDQMPPFFFWQSTWQEVTTSCTPTWTSPQKFIGKKRETIRQNNKIVLTIHRRKIIQRSTKLGKTLLQDLWLVKREK